MNPPVVMQHVPKVATQHGLFVSSSETEEPRLKPGQQELHRRGVYSFEAKKAFAATTSLALDLQNKSEFAHMHKTTPDDYLFPQGPSRPNEVSLSKGIDYRAPNTTRHWKPDSQAVGEEAGGAALEHRLAAKGAIRSWPFQMTPSIGRKDHSTHYTHHFGKYGSNPRDRINHDHTRLQVHPNSLNRGTTRGTSHIPGYQGFIAANPAGPLSARATSGEATRSVDKTNIGETFHTNLVGYAGHVPESHNNDFGGRRLTELTTHGRDFAPRSARS